MAATVDDLDLCDTALLTDVVGFKKHVDCLKDTQKVFISLFKDWIREPSNRIVLTTGGPGTGKTFTVIESLRFIRLPVLKLAYTGRIAQRIGGRTIHSALRLSWDEDSVMRKLERELNQIDDTETVLCQSRCLLEEFFYNGNYPQIVVIDEISMVVFYLLYWIVQFFFTNASKPVLVVLIGDQTQLTPVKSLYNAFGTIGAFEKAFGRIALVELRESVRFGENYAKVIQRLRELVGSEDDLFDFIQNTFPVVEEVNSELLKQCRRALVFRNETVQVLNRFYLRNFPGRTVRLYRLNVSDKEVDLESFVDVKSNCEIFVTKNTRTMTNGTPLVFLRYDPKNDELICKHPDTQITARVDRDPYTGKFPVTLGFAGTIHKFQGDTVDEPHVLFNFDGCRNTNLVYTALSRVRNMEQIAAVVL